MASHALIDAYLAGLGRRLPADATDELIDGLTETYEHHLARGLEPASAATTAIREFGQTEEILAAFTRHAPGRRTAAALLVTGPLLGGCWGASLVMGRAWTWPIPTAAKLPFGLALLAVVAVLATAAISRHDYARTRLAALGGAGLVLLDAAMLLAVWLAAPAIIWPMAFAIPASLARISFTVQSLPRILAR
ncbi:MAG TPA: permease prefix domain 1-containing protein [Actinomycetes bacterium]|jgi:hypothetical protein|nr:permease prefix domain 1-containing protein [Actinomycetes bacterium]